jgi:hypothetical protein
VTHFLQNNEQNVCTEIEKVTRCFLEGRLALFVFRGTRFFFSWLKAREMFTLKKSLITVCHSNRRKSPNFVRCSESDTNWLKIEQNKHYILEYKDREMKNSVSKSTYFPPYHEKYESTKNW